MCDCEIPKCSLFPFNFLFYGSISSFFGKVNSVEILNLICFFLFELEGELSFVGFFINPEKRESLKVSGEQEITWFTWCMQLYWNAPFEELV